MPTTVLASPYGSGSYGACTYGQGCSTSQSSSSSQAPASSGTEIILNDFSEFFSTGGKVLTLKVNQTVYFFVTTGNGQERHSVLIKFIGPNYVDIVVTSAPQEARLYVGETKQFDVTGDGKNDIEISLTSISTDGQATMTFKSLNQPTTAAAPASQTATAKRSFNWLLLLGSIALVMAAVIIYLFLLLRRRQQQDN